MESFSKIMSITSSEAYINNHSKKTLSLRKTVCFLSDLIFYKLSLIKGTTTKLYIILFLSKLRALRIIIQNILTQTRIVLLV